MNPQPPVTRIRFMGQVPPVANLSAGRLSGKARLRGRCPESPDPIGPASDATGQTKPRDAGRSRIGRPKPCRVTSSETRRRPAAASSTPEGSHSVEEPLQAIAGHERVYGIGL